MTKYNQAKAIIITCYFCCFIAGCNTFGSVGGTINFHTSTPKLENAIDSLYAKYPQYKMPQKWAQYNNLPVPGAPYIESKLFYFGSAPEEMYDVSLINDSLLSGNKSRSGLVIRGVYQGNGKWLMEEDINDKNERRIQKRFDDEITSKLEAYTKTKAREEE